MKTVILAGGKGLRIYEETKYKPKPMIKVGGIPLIEHIINIYKSYGFNDFIICGGYKYKIIKKYFNKSKFKNIKVVNTGLNTETGGRLFKIKKYLNKEENFFLTYGDGLSDINLKKLLKFHIKMNKIATVTAVKKNSSFGILKLSKKNSLVQNFIEKPKRQLINGGFFVFSNKIFKYIKNNKSIEFYYLPKLSKIRNFVAFSHNGFWQCLDNLKDKKILENHIKKK